MINKKKQKKKQKNKNISINKTPSKKHFYEWSRKDSN